LVADIFQLFGLFKIRHLKNVTKLQSYRVTKLQSYILVFSSFDVFVGMEGEPNWMDDWSRREGR
jgi:hypothetical protein